MQGAWHGTLFRVSRITPWAEGGAKPLNHPGVPVHCLQLSEILNESLFFFFKILFIYSWETHRERQRHRQREKQAPCREPDMGLYPRSPGSYPGLKVAPNRWAIGAALQHTFFGNKIHITKLTILTILRCTIQCSLIGLFVFVFWVVRRF